RNFSRFTKPQLGQVEQVDKGVSEALPLEIERDRGREHLLESRPLATAGDLDVQRSHPPVGAALERAAESKARKIVDGRCQQLFAALAKGAAGRRPMASGERVPEEFGRRCRLEE